MNVFHLTFAHHWQFTWGHTQCMACIHATSNDEVCRCLSLLCIVCWTMAYAPCMCMLRILCRMRIVLTCCVWHARAALNIAILPIDILATLLARRDTNGSPDDQSWELTSPVSMVKWNGVTSVLTGTFWWNKFAKLGYINLANRRPKTVTYGSKKPRFRWRTDSRKIRGFDVSFGIRNNTTW